MIYRQSGYTEKAANNTDYSYTKCSRAQIFKRDHVYNTRSSCGLWQNKVVDLDSMKSIMMYNDYLKDPLSEKKPNNVFLASLTILFVGDCLSL